MKIAILLLTLVCLSGCSTKVEVVEYVFDAIEKAIEDSIPVISNLNENESTPPEIEVPQQLEDVSSNEPDTSIPTGYYGSGEHMIKMSGTYTIHYKPDDMMSSVSLVVSDEETKSLILEPKICYEAGEPSVEQRCMTTVELEADNKIAVTGGAIVISENRSFEKTYKGSVEQRVGYRAGEDIPAGVYYALDETAYINPEKNTNMVYTSMGSWIVDMYETDVYTDYTFEKIYPNERFYLHEDMYIAIDGPVHLIYLGEFNY